MKKICLLIALLVNVGFVPNALAQTFDEAFAAFTEANASKDPAHPGYTKAYGIWSKFAESGDPASTYHLGVLHLYGLGGAAFDQIRGFDLIRAAAEGGYGKAQGYLGVIHEKGEGIHTTSGSEDALDWYQRAAKSGHCYSIRRLARAHESGELGLTKNPAEAAELKTSRADCFETATPAGTSG